MLGKFYREAMKRTFVQPYQKTFDHLFGKQIKVLNFRDLAV
jgi:hypothetical protein